MSTRHTETKSGDSNGGRTPDGRQHATAASYRAVHSEPRGVSEREYQFSRRHQGDYYVKGARDSYHRAGIDYGGPYGSTDYRSLPAYLGGTNARCTDSATYSKNSDRGWEHSRHAERPRGAKTSQSVRDRADVARGQDACDNDKPWSGGDRGERALTGHEGRSSRHPGPQQYAYRSSSHLPGSESTKSSRAPSHKPMDNYIADEQTGGYQSVDTCYRDNSMDDDLCDAIIQLNCDNVGSESNKVGDRPRRGDSPSVRPDVERSLSPPARGSSPFGVHAVSRERHRRDLTSRVSDSEGPGQGESTSSSSGSSSDSSSSGSSSSDNSDSSSDGASDDSNHCSGSRSIVTSDKMLPSNVSYHGRGGSDSEHGLVSARRRFTTYTTDVRSNSGKYGTDGQKRTFNRDHRSSEESDDGVTARVGQVTTDQIPRYHYRSSGGNSDAEDEGLSRTHSSHSCTSSDESATDDELPTRKPSDHRSSITNLSVTGKEIPSPLCDDVHISSDAKSAADHEILCYEHQNSSSDDESDVEDEILCHKHSDNRNCSDEKSDTEDEIPSRQHDEHRSGGDDERASECDISCQKNSAQASSSDEEDSAAGESPCHKHSGHASSSDEEDSAADESPFHKHSDHRRSSYDDRVTEDELSCQTHSDHDDSKRNESPTENKPPQSSYNIEHDKATVIGQAITRGYDIINSDHEDRASIHERDAEDDYPGDTYGGADASSERHTVDDGHDRHSDNGSTADKCGQTGYEPEGHQHSDRSPGSSDAIASKQESHGNRNTDGEGDDSTSSESDPGRGTMDADKISDGSDESLSESDRERSGSADENAVTMDMECRRGDHIETGDGTYETRYPHSGSPGNDFGVGIDGDITVTEEPDVVKELVLVVEDDDGMGTERTGRSRRKNSPGAHSKHRSQSSSSSHSDSSDSNCSTCTSSSSSSGGSVSDSDESNSNDNEHYNATTRSCKTTIKPCNTTVGPRSTTAGPCSTTSGTCSTTAGPCSTTAGPCSTTTRPCTNISPVEDESAWTANNMQPASYMLPDNSHATRNTLPGIESESLLLELPHTASSIPEASDIQPVITTTEFVQGINMMAVLPAAPHVSMSVLSDIQPSGLTSELPDTRPTASMSSELSEVQPLGSMSELPDARPAASMSELSDRQPSGSMSQLPDARPTSSMSSELPYVQHAASLSELFDALPVGFLSSIMNVHPVNPMSESSNIQPLSATEESPHTHAKSLGSANPGPVVNPERESGSMSVVDETVAKEMSPNALMPSLDVDEPEKTSPPVPDTRCDQLVQDEGSPRSTLGIDAGGTSALNTASHRVGDQLETALSDITNLWPAEALKLAPVEQIHVAVTEESRVESVIVANEESSTRDETPGDAEIQSLTLIASDVSGDDDDDTVKATNEPGIGSEGLSDCQRILRDDVTCPAEKESTDGVSAPVSVASGLGWTTLKPPEESKALTGSADHATTEQFKKPLIRIKIDGLKIKRLMLQPSPPVLPTEVEIDGDAKIPVKPVPQSEKEDSIQLTAMTSALDAESIESDAKKDLMLAVGEVVDKTEVADGVPQGTGGANDVVGAAVYKHPWDEIRSDSPSSVGDGHNENMARAANSERKEPVSRSRRSRSREERGVPVSRAMTRSRSKDRAKRSGSKERSRKSRSRDRTDKRRSRSRDRTDRRRSRSRNTRDRNRRRSRSMSRDRRSRWTGYRSRRFYRRSRSPSKGTNRRSRSRSVSRSRRCRDSLTPKDPTMLTSNVNSNDTAETLANRSALAEQPNERTQTANTVDEDKEGNMKKIATNDRKTSRDSRSSSCEQTYRRRWRGRDGYQRKSDDGRADSRRSRNSSRDRRTENSRDDRRGANSDWRGRDRTDEDRNRSQPRDNDRRRWRDTRERHGGGRPTSGQTQNSSQWTWTWDTAKQQYCYMPVTHITQCPEPQRIETISSKRPKKSKKAEGDSASYQNSAAFDLQSSAYTWPPLAADLSTPGPVSVEWTSALTTDEYLCSTWQTAAPVAIASEIPPNVDVPIAAEGDSKAPDICENSKGLILEEMFLSDYEESDSKRGDMDDMNTSDDDLCRDADIQVQPLGAPTEKGREPTPGRGQAAMSGCISIAPTVASPIVPPELEPSRSNGAEELSATPCLYRGSSSADATVRNWPECHHHPVVTAGNAGPDNGAIRLSEALGTATQASKLPSSTTGRSIGPQTTSGARHNTEDRALPGPTENAGSQLYDPYLPEAAVTTPVVSQVHDGNYHDEGFHTGNQHCREVDIGPLSLQSPNTPLPASQVVSNLTSPASEARSSYPGGFGSIWLSTADEAYNPQPGREFSGDTLEPSLSELDPVINRMCPDVLKESDDKRSDERRTDYDRDRSRYEDKCRPSDRDRGFERYTSSNRRDESDNNDASERNISRRSNKSYHRGVRGKKEAKFVRSRSGDDVSRSSGDDRVHDRDKEYRRKHRDEMKNNYRDSVGDVLKEKRSIETVEGDAGTATESDIATAGKDSVQTDTVPDDGASHRETKQLRLRDNMATTDRTGYDRSPRSDKKTYESETEDRADRQYAFRRRNDGPLISRDEANDIMISHKANCDDGDPHISCKDLKEKQATSKRAKDYTSKERSDGKHRRGTKREEVSEGSHYNEGHKRGDHGRGIDDHLSDDRRRINRERSRNDRDQTQRGLENNKERAARLEHEEPKGYVEEERRKSPYRNRSSDKKEDLERTKTRGRSSREVSQSSVKSTEGSVRSSGKRRRSSEEVAEADRVPAGYCFVEFPDQDIAQRAMLRLNGKMVPNARPFKRFKLNQASFGREHLNSPEYSLFLRDLTDEVDDLVLYSVFSRKYKSVKGAKVMMDNHGLSRGYGFVRFLDEDDQQMALIEMNNYVGIGRKPIKVSIATPKRHPDKGDDGSQMYPQHPMMYPGAPGYQMYPPHAAGWWQGYQMGPSYYGGYPGAAEGYDANYGYQQQYPEVQSQTYDEQCEDDGEELVDPETEIDVAKANKEFMERSEEFYVAMEASRWYPLDNALSTISPQVQIDAN